MKTQRMLLPRKLEEEGTAGKIAEVLDRHKARPWPGAEAEVPVLKLSRALEQAIRKARLQRRVRPGFEDIANKLAAEQKGLAGIRPSSDGATATRISRLLLFSNDGAPRLYRHIEQLYKQHYPRILACQIDVDGRSLGTLIAGGKGARGSGMKVILIEHKDAVADVLRSLMDDNQANGSWPP